MKIHEIMTREVYVAGPAQTIREAARIMAQYDTGALPVGDDQRLLGVITDRDIAVRAVAQGKSGDTPVSEIMSTEVLYCYEDEDVEHVTRNMGDVKVRRLPVMNRQKRLVGIVSIGDLAHEARPAVTGKAVADISRPGGAHTQSAPRPASGVRGEATDISKTAHL
jgi:CBS domain-containing protein